MAMVSVLMQKTAGGFPQFSNDRGNLFLKRTSIFTVVQWLNFFTIKKTTCYTSSILRFNLHAVLC